MFTVTESLIRVTLYVTDKYAQNEKQNKLGLWLQKWYQGHLVWALNEEHLSFLEGFISGTLRERKDGLVDGWSNNSLASRLPRWIKVSKNRKGLLKAISKLKEQV